jgi:hypothetical protein
MRAIYVRNPKKVTEGYAILIIELDEAEKEEFSRMKMEKLGIDLKNELLAEFFTHTFHGNIKYLRRLQKEFENILEIKCEIVDMEKPILIKKIFANIQNLSNSSTINAYLNSERPNSLNNGKMYVTIPTQRDWETEIVSECCMKIGVSVICNYQGMVILKSRRKEMEQLIPMLEKKLKKELDVAGRLISFELIPF